MAYSKGAGSLYHPRYPPPGKSYAEARAACRRESTARVCGPARAEGEVTMTGKPLRERCPRVPDDTRIDGERCDGRNPFDDNVHHCCLKVGHDGKHACWCGRDWTPR